jgi:hypothetical protein
MSGYFRVMATKTCMITGASRGLADAYEVLKIIQNIYLESSYDHSS